MSFFVFGNRSGNDSERFCGEVWDDSGVKLLDSSCLDFNVPINTWDAEETSGKCPSEDYCLWHDGSLPLSEGLELPSANNFSFWRRVNCYAPGETVISYQFSSPIELECMGKVQDGTTSGYPGIGDPKFVNAWCPTYGVGAEWKPIRNQPPFDPYAWGGKCVHNDQVCDAGTSSFIDQYENLYPDLAGVYDNISQLRCDRSADELLSNVSVGGSAEYCFRVFDDGEPFPGPVFPKFERCCPLVSFPIKAVNSSSGLVEDVDFWVFETDSVKIY